MGALLASRDVRSTVGANLALVRGKTGLDPWTAGRNELRAALEAAELSPVPPMDMRRIPSVNYRADQEELDRQQELINSIVIN